MKFWSGSLCVAGLVVAGCLCVYFYNFHDGWSSTQSDWGSFGGFISGVATPLISLLALIAFLQGLRMQQKEWRATQKALEVQGFDSLFFKLVDNYHRSIDLLEATVRRTASQGEYIFLSGAGAENSDYLYRGRRALIALSEHAKSLIDLQCSVGRLAEKSDKDKIIARSFNEEVRSGFFNKYENFEKKIPVALGSYFSSVFLLVNHFDHLRAEDKGIYLSVLRELLQDEDKLFLVFRCLGVKDLNPSELALCNSGIWADFLSGGLKCFHGLDVVGELSRRCRSVADADIVQ